MNSCGVSQTSMSDNSIFLKFLEVDDGSFLTPWKKSPVSENGKTSSCRDVQDQQSNNYISIYQGSFFSTDIMSSMFYKPKVNNSDSMFHKVNNSASMFCMPNFKDSNCCVIL
ncbi:hypothetical protein LIER_02482 [Lithospermum erythrorhizon]|uniref:Uncharacterized protein n=1 Tax=Lithospermum erythrorhizon TaxID=34254 RepID=A0AAV3NQQ8_LITER